MKSLFLLTLCLFLLSSIQGKAGDYLELSKNMVNEGTVLLENKNQALPLPSGTNIAIFGKNQNRFNFLKGGGGSGEVYTTYKRDIIYGLREKETQGKVNICPEVHDLYERFDAKPQGQEPLLTDELAKIGRAFADVAIFCYGREASEMYDRVVGKGDYFLSEQEEATLNTVLAQKFKKVIVILNIGNVGDSSWFYNQEGIDAVLCVWFPGMEGGLAIADMITGDAYPSGKLVDTMTKKWEDYPTSATYIESTEYVNYDEDIFVGYRHFETFPQSGANVNYEFGFGLGYTTFSIEKATGRLDGNNGVAFDATVTNTGKTYKGKEVVQVYVQAPQGKLGKAKRVLVGWQKTKELAPGETQTVTITVPFKYMASYDDLGKVQDAAFILEEGDYIFHVGSSVRKTVQVDYVYHLDKFVVIEQLSHLVVPTKLPRRLLADGTYEKLPTKSTTTDSSSSSILTKSSVSSNSNNDKYRTSSKWRKSKNSLKKKVTKKNAIMLQDVARDKSLLPQFLHQLPDEDLFVLLGGRPNTNQFTNTGAIGDMPQWGIPSCPTNDGPAGARLGNMQWPGGGNENTTQFPSATLVACMWNNELVEAFGAAVGQEMNDHGMSFWLAPGVNIHRNPLCGRNFEYFSEDPLVAGKAAAGVSRGTQSKGCSVTLKHFAANDREADRGGYDSRMSERAAREIHLKQFEIGVKEGLAWSIMTSYNVFNGLRPWDNKELLTDLVRGQWGYEGLIMTDWAIGGGQHIKVIAGNDVCMPEGDIAGLRQALGNGSISRDILERDVGHVMNVIMKLKVFKDFGANEKTNANKIKNERKLSNSAELSSDSKSESKFVGLHDNVMKEEGGLRGKFSKMAWKSKR